MLGQFGDLHAFEYEDGARAYASTLLNKPVAPAFLPDNIGFTGDTFDLVAMLDVLEHIEDDVGSLRALRERLREDGSILITVPAVPWLWSDHDEIHHHKRRYTKAGLRQVLQQAGLKVDHVSYFNTLLFPLALAQRLASRFSSKKFAGDSMPSRFVNGMLKSVFAFENRLAWRINLPVGLSLYAVARRV